jgi:hypothetical protein
VSPCELGDKNYKSGCLSVLQTDVENYAVLLGGVGIGVACIQVNLQLM